MTSSSSKLRGVVVLTGLIVLIAGLHMVARFGLSGPSELSFAGLATWTSDPVLAIATVARWLSLILAYYLAVVIAAVTVLGERLDDTRFGQIAPSRATGLIGLLLGTSAVIVPFAVDAQPHQGLRLEPVAADADANAEALELRQMEPPLVLSEIEESPEIRLVWSATWSNAAEHALDDRWYVESGDSFWSIAEETLRDEQPHSELTNEVIVDYWRTLIQANEDRLIDPTNPDFILPGQVVVLPPT